LGTDIYRDEEKQLCLTRFWGGEANGVSYQIGHKWKENFEFVRLTKAQLELLINAYLESEGKDVFIVSKKPKVED